MCLVHYVDCIVVGCRTVLVGEESVVDLVSDIASCGVSMLYLMRVCVSFGERVRVCVDFLSLLCWRVCVDFLSLLCCRFYVDVLSFILFGDRVCVDARTLLVRLYVRLVSLLMDIL